ncbi:hypothetical protein G6H35_000444 [Listeria monocytogenes]|nr:hypothetical protein [Listeria monocytogenes]EEO9541783.1 hypothetical protein [Listeria monocytogenes]EGT1733654.1 hypothetical protein [Listeria monocytogenes]
MIKLVKDGYNIHKDVIGMMKSNYNCYHGTITEVASEILEVRKFNPKYRNNHWLGNGVYFFIDDPTSAQIWPTLHRINKGKESGVIYCKVEVYRDRLLDLDTEADLKNFEEYLKQIENEYRIEVVGKKAEEVRCFVMDLLPKNDDENAIDVIKYTFVKGEYISMTYPQSMGMGLELHGAQICVRNQECIDKDSLKMHAYTC